jgi:peptidoglycan/LPS O-acetylase OafA/YrhL
MLDRAPPTAVAVVSVPDLKSNRLVGLDGLRGICALAVIIYHLLWYTDVAKLPAIGTYGVYVFFTLSGYVLFYKYGMRKLSADMLRDFFSARIWRILPVYLLVLAFVAYRDKTSISTIMLNASLLFSFSTPAISSAFGAGWSIGIECAFYVIFPIIMLIRTTFAHLVAFALTILAGWSASIFSDQIAAGSDAQFWQLHNQPASFLPFFVGGTLAARISADYPTRRSKLAFPFSLAILAAIFAWPHMFHLTRQEMLIGWSMPVLCLVASLTVWSAAQSSFETQGTRLLAFLGAISYPLYLTHLQVLMHLQISMKGSNIITVSVLFVVLSILLATLIHYAFEIPVGMIGRVVRGNNTAPLGA